MPYVYVFNISWSETKNIYAHETDIMLFSIRNLDFNTHFNFNNIQIDPVASHRHLGDHFSLYCKWTIYINTIIEMV